MEVKRLIGTDGQLVTVQFGTEKEGDGLEAVGTAGWYLITAIAETGSLFPQGLRVGHLMYLEADAVLETGDKAKPLTETIVAAVKGFNIDSSKAEYDVTVLNDSVKVYRIDTKVDHTGSLTGNVFLNDVTSDSIIGQFWSVVKQAKAGTVVVSEVNSSPLFFKGITNKQGEGEDTERFYFFPCGLTSFGNGASLDGVQEFSSNFRIVASNEVLPALYEREL